MGEIYGWGALHVCTVYNVCTYKCILVIPARVETFALDYEWSSRWVYSIKYFRLSKPFVNGVSPLHVEVFCFFFKFTLLSHSNAFQFLNIFCICSLFTNCSAALHSHWLIPPSKPVCFTLPKHEKKGQSLEFVLSCTRHSFCTVDQKGHICCCEGKRDSALWGAMLRLLSALRNMQLSHMANNLLSAGEIYWV